MAKNSMRDYVFTLNAGQELERNITGNWFHVIEANNEISIRFDDGDVITRSEGMGGSAEYEKITIISATAQTVKLSLGNGMVTDARATLNANITSTIEPANTYTPINDVNIPAASSAALVVANANRRGLIVTNPISNLNTFRLGIPLNVGAGRGDILEPGDTITLSTTAAISAYNGGAADESLVVNELEQV